MIDGWRKGQTDNSPTRKMEHLTPHYAASARTTGKEAKGCWNRKQELKNGRW